MPPVRLVSQFARHAIELAAAEGLTGNEADTHDALQEIFVRLARSPRLLEDVAAPRSFLFRMAHRLATNDDARARRRASAGMFVDTVSFSMCAQTTATPAFT